MAVNLVNLPVCFGVQNPKPPRGFPYGKLRWRLRPDDFVRARVKTWRGIEEFYVQEKDGFWEPFHEAGKNLTA
jgi:hypothetical protein